MASTPPPPTFWDWLWSWIFPASLADAIIILGALVGVVYWFQRWLFKPKLVIEVVPKEMKKQRNHPSEVLEFRDSLSFTVTNIHKTTAERCRAEVSSDSDLLKELGTSHRDLLNKAGEAEYDSDIGYMEEKRIDLFQMYAALSPQNNLAVTLTYDKRKFGNEPIVGDNTTVANTPSPPSIFNFPGISTEYVTFPGGWGKATVTVRGNGVEKTQVFSFMVAYSRDPQAVREGRAEPFHIHVLPPVVTRLQRFKAWMGHSLKGTRIVSGIESSIPLTA
jgi:hypothetical protein